MQDKFTKDLLHFVNVLSPESPLPMVLEAEGSIIFLFATSMASVKNVLLN